METNTDYIVIKRYFDVKDFFKTLPSISKFYGAGTFLEKDSRYTLLTLNENVYLFKEKAVEKKDVERKEVGDKDKDKDKDIHIHNLNTNNLAVKTPNTLVKNNNIFSSNSLNSPKASMPFSKPVFYFDSIEEVEKTFLKSDFFKKSRQMGKIKYGDFETDLAVEVKLYPYSNEDRLIINPAGKIDLIYSLHFHHEEINDLDAHSSLDKAINENENENHNDSTLSGFKIKFEYKQFPSLENVIKTDKFNKKLNARLNTFTNK